MKGLAGDSLKVVNQTWASSVVGIVAEADTELNFI